MAVEPCAATNLRATARGAAARDSGEAFRLNCDLLAGLTFPLRRFRRFTPASAFCPPPEKVPAEERHYNHHENDHQTYL